MPACAHASAPHHGRARGHRRTTPGKGKPRPGGDGAGGNDMAGSTGFEPAISSVTGWHVRPLHHEPVPTAKDIRCGRLRRAGMAASRRGRLPRPWRPARSAAGLIAEPGPAAGTWSGHLARDSLGVTHWGPFPVRAGQRKADEPRQTRNLRQNPLSRPTRAAPRAPERGSEWRSRGERIADRRWPQPAAKSARRHILGLPFCGGSASPKARRDS